MFVTLSDDWQQATASLSNVVDSVPTSVPMSVIRVFIIVVDHQCDNSVVLEVLTTTLPLFINVLQLSMTVLVKVCNTFIHF